MSSLLRPLRSFRKPGWFGDFRTFVMRGNVVDLAVGIVIGAAFTGIVASLVKDILNPIIGLLTGGVRFSNHFLVLKGIPVATLAEAQKAGDVTLNYGVFIDSIINFLIIAVAIFWIVRMLAKLHKAPAPAVPPATPVPSPTETLLCEIRDLLRNR